MTSSPARALITVNYLPWFLFGILCACLFPSPADAQPPVFLTQERVFVLSARSPDPVRTEIQWADRIEGPWSALTNVVAGPAGAEFVIEGSGAAPRFYRSIVDPRPVAPPGFVWIPPGTFLMGSPSTEIGRNPDENRHEVILTRGFWMSDHVLDSFSLIETLESLSVDRQNLELFPTRLSWETARLYVELRTANDRASGLISAGAEYRLPTEAEWEYAARAGNDGSFWPQDTTNRWGLYPIPSLNDFDDKKEWCQDWYGPYGEGSFRDPIGPECGDRHAQRASIRFADRMSAIRRTNGVLDPDFSEGAAIRLVLSLSDARTGPAGAVGSVREVIPRLGLKSATRLTVEAPWGTPVRVEIALEPGGPWSTWTNILANGEAMVLLDPTQEPGTPRYRAALDPVSSGTTGFVYISPGTFTMGSPPSERMSLVYWYSRFDPEQEAPVAVTKGFWMCDHEVTQAEYLDVMNANPSRIRYDPALPVYRVQPYKAVEYCNRLTARERSAGRLPADQIYRLPSRGEWEYAARAGTSGRFYGPIREITSIRSIAVGPKPVRQGRPNAWGLYDMIGNVAEMATGGDDLYYLLNGYGGYTRLRTDPNASPGTDGWFLVDPQGAYQYPRFLCGDPDLGMMGVALKRPLPFGYADDALGLLGFRVVRSAAPTFTERPRIVEEPRSVRCATRQEVKLTVKASGSWPLEYRWTRNGKPVESQTQGSPDGYPPGRTTSLEILSASSADAGEYQVTVSNSAGSVTSAAVSVIVEPPPDKGPPGFQWIPPGSFHWTPREDEYRATLTRGFWICDHETTQSEYQSIMGRNPSFNRGEDLPVEMVSRADALEYCQRLTELMRAAGQIEPRSAFRLPTVAEWDYALLAGRWRVTPVGGQYREEAWIRENAEGRTHPVKKRAANPWGLYDMLGNVQEMCSDGGVIYRRYQASTDPVGSLVGDLRGVSFIYPENPEDWTLSFPVSFFNSEWHEWGEPRIANCQEWNDRSVHLEYPDNDVGFRVVLSPLPDARGGYVFIPPGTFTMGSPETETGRRADETEHSVVVTRGFWMSDHEVTQGEYESVMGLNPSRYQGAARPVEGVTWNDAVLYCRRLTLRDRSLGKIRPEEAYRLPTESEWEYAARAGRPGPRHGELNEVACWRGSSGNLETWPVRSGMANDWGLFDMLGNVGEWCADRYGAYPKGTTADPLPGRGAGRVWRGGDCTSEVAALRSAARNSADAEASGLLIGFRPVLSMEPSYARGFRSVAPGTFLMGSPTDEEGRNGDEVRHPVTISREFWICDHEVTHLEFHDVFGDPLERPREYIDFVLNKIGSDGVSKALTLVPFSLARLYCQRLTRLERDSGLISDREEYRLPTEAEWEYSARAGTSGAVYGELDSIASWSGNVWNERNLSVKSRAPNDWGLYDMIGNVWEWCADWYGAYPDASVSDPRGPASGSRGVLRGGAWNQLANRCRLATRLPADRDCSDRSIGFRVVLGVTP